MPITCDIDSEAGIVYTTLKGEVSTDEVLAALASVIRHPDFRPGLNGLVDLRESEYEMHTDDVKRLAAFMTLQREQIVPSKSAIVVSRDFTYGMTRMYQAFAEESAIETEIFRDLDEARRWLGLTDRSDECPAALPFHGRTPIERGNAAR